MMPTDVTPSGVPSPVRSLRRVEARFTDPAHGDALFVTDPLGVNTGTVLLEEPPIAAEQSLLSRERGMRCCPRCLGFISTAEAELQRLDCLLDETDLPNKDDVREALCVIVRAAERKLRVRGALFPFPWFLSCTDDESCRTCPACQQQISPDAVYLPVEEASPGMRQASEELLSIGNQQDERARLLLQLTVSAARAVRTAEETPSTTCVVVAVRHRLEALVDSLALGEMISLNPKQRTLMRRVATLLAQIVREACRCRSCHPGTIGTSSPAVISAQLVFQLRCALDTNLHTCIVVNPLWSFVRAEFARRRHDPTPPPADALSAALPLATALFEHVDALVLHNSGFALYHTGSKFNHSCVPNAEFVPTEAPVRARVLARCPIADGAEARISYIAVDGETKASRSAALRHYGFDCDCPLCLSSDAP